MTDGTERRAIKKRVTEVLRDHPVAVGVLFGSQARGEANRGSDIDVAVEFEDSVEDRFKALLALGSDLACALGTDDVDVIGLRSASPALVRAVFTDGEVLVGTAREARHLRERLLADADEDGRSPAERFDDALAAIDDHLA
jgi:predicted nucleotidyltransferase